MGIAQWRAEIGSVSVPGIALRIVLGAHRGGNHGLPSLTLDSEPAVHLVADIESIIEGQRHKGGRYRASHALDNESDLLHLVLDV